MANEMTVRDLKKYISTHSVDGFLDMDEGAYFSVAPEDIQEEGSLILSCGTLHEQIELEDDEIVRVEEKTSTILLPIWDDYHGVDELTPFLMLSKTFNT